MRKRERKRDEDKKGQNVEGIKRLIVSGYKPIKRKISIELRPLTILAGKNSSGKSSMIQPLLLLKQTLEAGYDPGPLLINGPNIKFSNPDQMVSRIGKSGYSNTMYFGIELATEDYLLIYFKRDPKEIFHISRMVFYDGEDKIILRRGMTEKSIRDAIPKYMKKYITANFRWETTKLKWGLGRRNCFLTFKVSPSSAKRRKGFGPILETTPAYLFERDIRRVIHVPALRGNPERNYPVTHIGDTFPGTFERYTASLINHWQNTDPEKITKLGKYLRALGLTSKIIASKKPGDAQVELKIEKHPLIFKKSEEDFVSIADVGFGVSQVLHIFVALLAAKPGQVLFLEDPESHLHPKGQLELATPLLDAAKKGVTVVVETHSGLLLKGIQTIVGNEETDISHLIKLHWFRRNNRGIASVESVGISRNGVFEKWPVDFGKVSLEAEREYLKAVRKKKNYREE